MRQRLATIDQGLDLAQRVAPKYAGAWQGLPAEHRAALALYFLPHGSGKPVLGPTRPRVIKWYCPFADQREFPSGHRYCINVYTGCSHGCVYCYAAGYLRMDARPKADFRRTLLKDLADLERFDVPPAPVHLSNSTDCLQPLETRQGDTLAALRALARHRGRFTTVTVLTKRPALLTAPAYLDAVSALAGPDERRVVVEVSLAFGREDVAAAYDPGAPGVGQRMEGIRRLREMRAGTPVVLRLSPTYPMDAPAPGGIPPQTRADVHRLIAFAAEVGVEKVVHTPAKIVRPKHGRLHPLMEAMLAVYRKLAAPRAVDFHGGAWRLPPDAAERHVVAPLRAICQEHGLPCDFCKHHLLGTP